ncbi:MAG: endonuclease/exonuclease/phosphatase family protein [Bacillus sp. (in: firmicutes)]
MRLLTWNIRQGGSRVRFDSIINALMEHQSDVIVLTEFWDNAKGNAIKKSLFAMGYTHQNTHVSPYKVDSVFIASKIDFTDVTDMNEYAVPYERWVELYFPVQDLYLLGIHIPNHMTRLRDRELFASEMLAYAKNHMEDRCVIIGDYNMSMLVDSEGPPLSCTDKMVELHRLGWIDTWRYTHKRENEYSWRDTLGAGFRIDHAYISPKLEESLQKCQFSHQERREQVSDHSVLIVDLRI